MCYVQRRWPQSFPGFPLFFCNKIQFFHHFPRFHHENYSFPPGKGREKGSQVPTASRMGFLSPGGRREWVGGGWGLGVGWVVGGGGVLPCTQLASHHLAAPASGAQATANGSQTRVPVDHRRLRWHPPLGLFSIPEATGGCQKRFKAASPPARKHTTIQSQPANQKTCGMALE